MRRPSWTVTLDVGHVAGGEDAEGTDGEVHRLAGGIDRDALAPHQAERLVHGSERVGAQRRPGPARRRPTRPPRPARARLLRDRPRPRRGRPRAPRGWRDTSRRVVAWARNAASGAPGPRPSRHHADPHDTVGPTIGTSSTSRSGTRVRSRDTSGDRSGDPALRPTRTWPEPSARSAIASGGRLGPLRTTSSRRQRTRAGRPVRSARRRASSGAVLARFPPKAPPLARGEAGTPAGSHQLASVST